MPSGRVPYKSQYQDSIIELRNLHKDWSMLKIARNVGCAKKTVRYQLRKNNMASGFPPSPPHLLTISFGKLKELYFECEMTLQEIGDAYSVSRERVRQVMERAGLKRRPVGPMGRRLSLRFIPRGF